MDTFNLILIIGGGVIALYFITRFAFRLGYKLAMLEAMNTIQQVSKSSGGKPVDMSKVEKLEMRKENGIFYMYTVNGGEFIAQGKNGDELTTSIGDRFPNRMFSISQADLNQLIAESNKND
jgi:hypothetical protein